jgi:hypothetical protein
LSERAWWAIHTTIEVTIATATKAMTVSRRSCCCCGRLLSMISSTTATPAQIVTAAITPTHTQRSWRDAPR